MLYNHKHYRNHGTTPDQDGVILPGQLAAELSDRPHVAELAPHVLGLPQLLGEPGVGDHLRLSRHRSSTATFIH